MEVIDEPTINLIGHNAALLIPAPDHLGKFFQPGDAVAGHYPLRGVGQIKVAGQQAAGPAEQLLCHILCGFGREGGLQDHQIPFLEDFAQGLQSALHDRKVGIVAGIHKHRHYDYECPAACRILEARRGYKPLAAMSL